MPQSEQPEAVLMRTAMRVGHLPYSRGMHTSSLVVPELLFSDHEAIDLLSIDLAFKFREDKIDVVVAPAPNASVLAKLTAKALYIWQDQKIKVRPIYADRGTRREITFSFRAPFLPQLKEKRVLLVNDFMHSGKTILALADAVKKAGGTVVGCGVICHRGEMTSELLGYPLRFLVEKREETWKTKDCPLCAQRIPLEPIR